MRGKNQRETVVLPKGQNHIESVALAAGWSQIEQRLLELILEPG